MSDDLAITAYLIHDRPTMGLYPAPLERGWMNAAVDRHPYRCLPLNIANQNGWVLTSPTSFRVYWYGGPNPQDLEVKFDGEPDPTVSSHFGSGVVTFSLPYLFRTPPGINLWVKGPSNWPKDGLHPLEGVVETDWAVSTFTMNWKVTRVCEWVGFAAGEPFCMLVPVPRGFAEGFVPRTMPLSSDAELKAKYEAWEASRKGFLRGLHDLDPEAVKRGWQKDYFQGKTAEGGTFAGHQTRLSIKPFPLDQPPA